MAVNRVRKFGRAWREAVAKIKSGVVSPIDLRLTMYATTSCDIQYRLAHSPATAGWSSLIQFQTLAQISELLNRPDRLDTFITFINRAHPTPRPVVEMGPGPIDSSEDIFARTATRLSMGTGILAQQRTYSQTIPGFIGGPGPVPAERPRRQTELQERMEAAISSIFSQERFVGSGPVGG